MEAKQLKLTFLLAVLMSIVGAKAFAHDIEVANADGKTIYYTYTNNKTELAVSYRGSSSSSYSYEYSGVVNIPESVTYNGTTYPVTSIGNYAFYNCGGLTSVTIPNSVTSIGEFAFRDCSGLTSVTIPNSVTSIGRYAFRSCSGLTSVTIGNSVTSIGNDAFSGCTGLTSVTIPNSVTSIGGGAFQYCSGLTSVTIGNSVTSIGYDAFSDCTGLTSVTIGNSVTSIGAGAFSGCTGLTSVTIPNSVTSIGSKAFDGFWLKSLTIGTGVLSIGSDAFRSKKTIWLTNTPPSGYTNGSGTVNYVANELYTNLTNKMIYPFLSSMFEVGGVKYVPVSPSERTCDAIDCLYNTSAENIHISNTVSNKGVSLTVKNIQPYICYGNTFVKTVNVDYTGNIPQYAFYNCAGIRTLMVSNTGIVSTYAFQNCTGLETATISNQGCIDNDAFSGSKITNNLTVSNGSYIGARAFSNITGEFAAIINNKDYIGKEAFKNSTGLKTLEIGTNVTNLNDNSFYGCTKLEAVTIKNNGNVGKNSFEGCAALKTAIISNQGSLGASAFYKCASLESATIDNKGDIGANAFYECKALKEANVFNLGNVGNRAFYNCTGMTTANIYNQGDIGEEAFAKCTSLTTAAIDNNGNIDNKAFDGCIGLVTATLGENIPSVGTYAFNGCSSLKAITIPNNVKTLGENAFYNCSSMETVMMGTGIKSIEPYTFSKCASLKDVQIGSNVATINRYAFSDCTSLPAINIPKAVTDIKDYVFQNCAGLKTVIMEERDTILNLGSNGSNPLFASCPLDSVYIGRNIIYSTSSSYGYSPFYRNTSLRAVMITDKETEISENEFYGCTNLKVVKIGDGVESIGNWAFSGCSSIDYFAFGSAVKTIGEEAFSDCTEMTKLISRAATPPTCGSQALDDINKWNCTLHVPVGGTAAYKGAAQWKEFFYVSEGNDELFRLTYMVDGEVYKSYNVQYGSAITPEAEPTKEGYTFSGWSYIPETMPAYDVVVNGTFTKNGTGPDTPTANILIVTEQTGAKGKQIVLPIGLKNENDITGLQMDLYLPEGVTVAMNARGKMIISTTDRMEGNYTISSNDMGGYIRILGYSADGDAFLGTEGDILNVTLDIGESIADGDYIIQLKNIVLSDINNTEYRPTDVEATLKIASFIPGDVDNSGEVNINDVVCIINYILNRSTGTFITAAADVDENSEININDVVMLINRYILMRNNAPAMMIAAKKMPEVTAVTDENYMHLADLAIAPGETKEIELLMTNVGEVTASQGNIKLPEGLSFVTKSNGKVDAKNIDSRSEDFTLSCAIQNDGSLTYAHYSADGFSYEGNNGGVFKFKVKASETATAGTYSIGLSNVVLSIGGVGYHIPDRTSIVMITETTGIKDVKHDPLTTDRYNTLDGKLLNGKPTKAGIYIVNGKKVVIK